jgi:hypothetical protein
MVAGVRFGLGARKTQPLTTCRGIHSHSSWSQIWIRSQENTATDTLQGKLQPWQLESGWDQENTATHNLQGKSQPWQMESGLDQENTATHKLQGKLQPWQLGSDLGQEPGKHSHSQPAGEITDMAAGVIFGPGARKTQPLTP